MYRDVIDALLPGGSLWSPEDGADLDLLLDGMAGNSDRMLTFLHGLARLRNPMLTPILADLEEEYGIIPDDSVDDATRRTRLYATKTSRSSDGSGPWIESKLRQAGFDVYVHINNPAVDPASFLNYGTDVAFGTDPSQFGVAPDQFVGKGGSLLVNGPLYVSQSLVVYASPGSSVYWPLVFAIGGAATRDGSGAITAITTAQVPVIRKTEFIRTIIKLKPMFTWVAMMVEYV